MPCSKMRWKARCDLLKVPYLKIAFVLLTWHYISYGENLLILQSCASARSVRAIVGGAEARRDAISDILH